jgi:hypothetical protein
MAWVIHCRTKGNRTRYRLWSTIVDAYVTEELSEEEVKREILEEEVREVTERVQRETPARIENAKRTGTSSDMEDPHDLYGPWKLE